MTDMGYTPETPGIIVVTEQSPPSVIVSEGRQGPPGPPGESLIAGKFVQVQQLSAQDMLEFNGNVWVNVPKIEVTDGGNF